MTVSWQGKAIDAILDEGSYGLQYWIAFMPLYEAAFGGNGGRGDLGMLLARYDQQRGLLVEQLEQVGEVLKTALTAVDSEWDAQRNYTGRLPALWQGPAAGTALEMLTEQSLSADEDRQHVQEVSRTIDPMVNSLRRSVAAKADAVLGLLEDAGNGSRVVKIDGKTPEDVRVIVEVHNAREWISGEQVRDLDRIFPELGVPPYRTKGNQDLTDTYGGKIRDTVRDWLGLFKRDFDAKLTRYVDICEHTDKHIALQYQNLVGALAAIPERSYPRPEGLTTSHYGERKRPAPYVSFGSPDTPPPATASAGTTSGIVSPSVAPGSMGTAPIPGSVAPIPGSMAPGSMSAVPMMPNPQTAPVPADPAAQPQAGLSVLGEVAKELSPLATGLARSVEHGITALSETIKSGVDEAIEKFTTGSEPENTRTVGTPAEQDEAGTPEEESDTPPPDTPSPGTTLPGAVEFDIAGKHLKFEMEPEGRLKLLLSDSMGEQQEFHLGLDEHGMPFISRKEPEEPAPPTDPAVFGVPGGGESVGSGSVSGVPGGDESVGSGSVSGVPGGDESVGSGSVPEAPDKGTPADQCPVPDPGTVGPGKSGTPTGPTPTTRSADDDEHRPEPVPDPNAEDPETPFDTGAELAEAGPL
ncbi:hypothetical protein ACL02S_14420 [Nocardia sp. 004]|uniref:hypothetical protein n=1 Tax=Nocardia sp. 004 TaxID=3385978 RepID=UPI00399F4693